MNMFKVLRRREDYERKMRRENPLPGWVDAFVWYNAAYLIPISPRLTGLGLSPHGHVHDGGRAPHGPRHGVRHHNDVAGLEVLQGPQHGVGADKGRQDDGGV
jgi:hypothetical protein